MKELLNCITQIHKQNISDKNRPYNIFSVMDIGTREVYICRLLADLLNPQGEHNAGSAFLKLFLPMVLNIDDIPDEELANTIITTEYPIPSTDRRIDIVIEIGKRFIPIEAKINASDQESQCYDYYHFARTKDSQAQIYYLTKTGYEPSEESLKGKKDSLPVEEFSLISFQTDIYNWLKASTGLANADVRMVLEQFMDNIDSICMTIGSEEKMMIKNELCATEENLRAGILIEKSIAAAKCQVMADLFNEFEIQIKPLAEKYHWIREADIKWYEHSDCNNESFYKKYSTFPGINYHVVDAKFKQEYQIWFRIEVENHLLAGFTLFDPKGDDGKGAELDVFKSNTEIQKYLRVTENEYDGWWIKWWFLPAGGMTSNAEVPNFKDMNDAAIVLVDSEKRKNFVERCIKQIDYMVSNVIIDK